MIKLRDLQYLDAIDRHKHFGRAAEACFVSQPTLSAQIMKLEEYVGFSLVERHRRNVMLTPQGAALVLQARKVLKSAQEFEDAARALADPLAGDFKIGMIPTLAPYLLPHIMQGLTEALPKVNHFLYEKQTHDLLADLDKGDLDLLVLPWLEEMDRFERYTVMTEPLLLAVHPQHRLARRKSVTLDDLRDETVLTLEDGHCLRDQAMGYCFSAGADEDKRFQATSLETLRYMVASGSGITLLPRLATLNQPDSGLIRYLPFKKPAPEREITIVIRPHYPRMDCVRAIVSSVRESIAALQAANKL
ncbi:MAG TPA: DNA-binding transcriptional regulator OxyR [Gammaproteobacteria bacterium]|jgi:LysR family hydrogen peroxide-inducible transcriptional activator|nr:DNA-binding transcriptional regulator OxyR [Gammaproteobacteria bacterium]